MLLGMQYACMYAEKPMEIRPFLTMENYNLSNHAGKTPKDLTTKEITTKMMTRVIDEPEYYI